MNMICIDTDWTSSKGNLPVCRIEGSALPRHAANSLLKRNPKGRSVRIADMGFDEAVMLRAALEEAFAKL